jgi:hypothetical protein
VAVVIDQMDVEAVPQQTRSSGSEGSSAGAAQLESTMKRQIEQSMRRAHERAKRLVAD